MNRRDKANHIKTHASKKLRLNLRILGVVYAILLLVTIYHLVISNAIFWQVVLAIVIGFIAGTISARMYKISWDKGEEEVVGTMDTYGVLVLILFVLFELNREWIAGWFASAETIGTVSLVLLTGALIGRIVATSKEIMRIVREQDLL